MLGHLLSFVKAFLGHIPGALNVPLLSDSERSAVGLTYKRGRNEHWTAKILALEFISPKLPQLIRIIRDHLSKKTIDQDSMEAKNSSLSSSSFSAENPVRPAVLVHCWRGGMRSASVAWLLRVFGIEVFTLEGGYKSFRQHALKSLEDTNRNIFLLGGYTGSGKSEILDALKRKGQQVIDLEALAQHRGSVFGDILERKPGEPSPCASMVTQEQFENNLSLSWQRTHDLLPVWLESESKRIGYVNLPNSFWERMERSPLLFLEVPLEWRVEHVTSQYHAVSPSVLSVRVERIGRSLGGALLKEILDRLASGDLRGTCRALMLNYYDPRYKRALSKREHLYVLPLDLSNESHIDPEICARRVLDFLQTHSDPFLRRFLDTVRQQNDNISMLSQ